MDEKNSNNTAKLKSSWAVNSQLSRLWHKVVQELKVW